MLRDWQRLSSAPSVSLLRASHSSELCWTRFFVRRSSSLERDVLDTLALAAYDFFYVWGSSSAGRAPRLILGDLSYNKARLCRDRENLELVESALIRLRITSLSIVVIDARWKRSTKHILNAGKLDWRRGSWSGGYFKAHSPVFYREVRRKMPTVRVAEAQSCNWESSFDHRPY